MKSIEVRLTGGLGNQMFGAATGYALSRLIGFPLVLDLGAFNAVNSRKYELEIFEGPKILKLKSRSNSIVHKFAEKFEIVKPELFRESCFCFDQKFFQISTPITLEGYFQSWKYFDHIKVELKDFFKSDRINSVSRAIENRVGKEYIGIHLRRGDYLNSEYSSFHGLASEEYALRAFGEIKDLARPGLPKVFFTDSPETFSREFLDNFDLVVDPNWGKHPWEHMEALSQSAHLILSNSSFSWWAGYLGEQSGRIVVVPNKWFSNLKPNLEDLFLPTWIRLEN